MFSSAEYDIFYANKYENANNSRYFSYLLAEKISYSAEVRMKHVLKLRESQQLKLIKEQLNFTDSNTRWLVIQIYIKKVTTKN